MSGSFRRNVGVGGPGREDRAGEPESVPAEAGPAGRPSSLLVTAAVPCGLRGWPRRGWTRVECLL